MYRVYWTSASGKQHIDETDKKGLAMLKLMIAAHGGTIQRIEDITAQN